MEAASRSAAGACATRPRAAAVPRPRPRGPAPPAVRHVCNAADRADVSLGIDLGTTNSVACLVAAGGAPELVAVEGAAWTLPSAVAYRSDGRVVVGSRAQRYAAKHPGAAFHSFKRFLARPHADVRQTLKSLAFKTRELEDGSVGMVCDRAPGGMVTPQQASTHVLRRLLRAVEERTGAAPERAVVSVPAYFEAPQRAATIAAAEAAGLAKVKLIHEPVASALAYGIDAADDQTVLVFDLGGGTFDVSILEVLATGGDAFLGGDDWDAALARHLAKHLFTRRGAAATSPAVRARLRAVARAAKEQLSECEAVQVAVPAAGGATFTLTRSALQDVTADLFRRCREPVERACWQAGVDLGALYSEREERARQPVLSRRGDPDAPAVIHTNKARMPISEVLLVGGATRMPAVRDAVQHMTGLPPRPELVDPDAAVAIGAALHAATLSGHVENLMTIDVWQAALLRAVVGKQFEADPVLAARFVPEDDEARSGAEEIAPIAAAASSSVQAAPQTATPAKPSK